MRSAALLLGLAVLAAGAPAGLVAGPTPDAAPVATAPASPTTGASEDAALRTAGMRLYRRHCATCHGATGRGDGPDAWLFDPRPPDLRADFLRRHPTQDLVDRIRAGAPLELAFDLPALRQRAQEVEAIAKHLERLPTVNWRVMERGQELWIDRCELCHGPFGGPVDPVPPGVDRPRDLSDPAFQRATGDAALRVTVRHGRAGMPALVPRVPDEDVEPLLAFVRFLSPGHTQYLRYCAACHGEDGRGAGSFAEAGPARPAVVFDREYFRRRSPEEVRAAIWHMLDREKPRMPHFRTVLDEPAARAIVTYLRASE